MGLVSETCAVRIIFSNYYSNLKFLAVFISHISKNCMREAVFSILFNIKTHGCFVTYREPVENWKTTSLPDMSLYFRKEAEYAFHRGLAESTDVTVSHSDTSRITPGLLVRISGLTTRKINNAEETRADREH